ncbi:UNVERIFIED_CONTAM: hypothetical protein GTU68_056538, partial [Idotea baltica]|nr:hypothetical protein [Idotea baltica]
MRTTIAIAGSTGSIGTQTLDVVGSDPDRYEVVALAAGRSVEQLIDQANLVRPKLVAIADADLAQQLSAGVPDGVEVIAGPDALAEVAKIADVTINGVVGFAGLPVTLACLEAGKRLGLANKESLIAAGPVVQKARRTPGAELIPVDSEHAAIHMCLRSNANDRQVSRIQITASGGPFRGRSVSDLEHVSIEDALAHPTWA